MDPWAWLVFWVGWASKTRPTRQDSGGQVGGWFAGFGVRNGSRFHPV
jgi:hypothetical protein